MVSIQKTLPNILRNCYQEIPENIIIIMQFAGWDDILISYKSLIDGANGFAQAYSREGLMSGEVIVLILPHSAVLLKGLTALNFV